MAAAEKKALASGASRAKAIDAVRDYFYRGDIAHKIDEFSKANGGLLRYEDMAAFRLQPEEPVSTTFHGYTVYKPGFWSQGPTMIETLNILDGYDIPELKMNSADYIHTLVEALKLAYADRDTYYGDPKFVKIPAERLLSKEYGAERRKLITNEASLDFRPGSDRSPIRRSILTIRRSRGTRSTDALLAKDTTCVDAIDKDGIAISITPSGAWLPSVIAGDTGIPLTERAQSFLLVRGHPNELAGGKRPRVTLSPTLVVGPNNTLLTLSTPGGDVQEQSLLQVLLYATVWGMNAEQAVEAPRFQTEHLVASFDNHAMSPGSLLLDERTPPASIAELQKRHHVVEMRSRYVERVGAGVDPAAADGADRSGRGPVLLPVVAGVVGPLFEEPGRIRSRRAGATRLRALAAEHIYIGGSSWKYEGWLGQIYSARAVPLARQIFEESCSRPKCLREYAETFPTVCGDFAFYQFPTEEFWRKLFHQTPAGFRFAFKVPEQITCKVFPTHPRYGPQAGQENEAFLDARMLSTRCSCARCCRIGRRRRC